MAATSPRKREAVAVEPRPFDVALNRVLILCAFAISMGHLEAVVVVYLRKLLGFIPATEDFTRVAVDGIPGWILSVEQTRETATIVMLVCLALLAGRCAWERIGAFLIAFGVWDITYYIALRVMIEWPPSLASQDLLFLIPDKWYAPVWLPVLASCVMIALGLGCYRLAFPRRA